MKDKSILILLAASLVLIGCGAGPDDTPAVESVSGDEEMVELAIAGTIGIEMGDSNYVLGAVQAIDHDMNGDILVLDRFNCCIKVYSPEGEFLRQISHEGSGPGELLNPMSMTVVGDGRIFVETPWSGGMHAYETDGEWLGLVTPFTNNPPLITIGADSNAYVANRLQVLPDDNGSLMVTTFIGRYVEEEEPEVIYWQDEFPFDPNDLTSLLRGSVLGRVFSADRNGNIFIADRSSEEYLVQGFRADGELFMEIEQEPRRIEKTPEEIEEESTFMEAYLESIGAQGVLLEYNPDPLRDNISELEVDGENRIWVRRGTTIEPVFDVYDYEGEMLFTATVPEAGDDAPFWDFNIDEQGMTAYSVNPELFQQVYILEFPEQQE